MKPIAVKGLCVLFLFLIIINSALAFEKIVMTENGFEPSFIKIKQGTKLVWETEDDSAYWPASDFHPTHSQYSESGGCIGGDLDACKELTRGEQFSFVFNKPGTWGIHDHLHPGLNMVVEVESDPRKNLFAKKNPNKNSVPLQNHIKLTPVDQAILSKNVCMNSSEKDKCFA